MLRLTCGDSGRLAAAKQCLEPATPARDQAQLLVRCYRALYVVHNSDGVAMRHLPRVMEGPPGGVPHLLIVGDDRLADVVAWLEVRAGQTGQG